MMQLDGLRREIFEKRYAMADEKDWGQLADRVASVISRVEINGAADEWKRKFKKSLGDGDFMPGGRILFGAGRSQFNMLNCYRLHPSDTAASIGKMIQDTYLISCGGGGIGFNFSDIRPKGDNIQTIKYSAPGAVSVMQMVNEIGHHVKSGKNRRTALIAILNVTHPDLLEFLHVKLNLNELTNFNISIGITNEFIEAVRTNAPWSFRFQGREYKVYNLRRGEEPQGDPEVTKAADIIQVVALSPEDAVGRAMMHYRVSQDDEFTCLGEANLRARDIWDMMVQNSWASGDPGIYNIDLANSYTNVSYFESLESPNPCSIGTTLVAVADGRGDLPIKRLAEEGKDVPVYCLDDDGKIAIKMMRHPRLTGEDVPVFKVTIEGDHEITVTANHKFLLTDGTYKRADELVSGDSLSIAGKSIRQYANSGSKVGYHHLLGAGSRNKSEHRMIYEFFNGPIPDGHVIHHKDFNSLNNSPDNLVCLSVEEHDKLHGEAMMGEKNPMRQDYPQEWWDRYHKNMSAAVSGSKNGRYSGHSIESIKKHALSLTRELNRRFSKREWQDYATQHNLPLHFSDWRKQHFQSITALAKWAALECDLENIDADPRLIRTYQDLTQQGYDCVIEHHRVCVLKECEDCGSGLKVWSQRREVSICQSCAALRASNAALSGDVYKKRMSRLANRKAATRHEQARVYSTLRFKLNRDPLKKEWQIACKEEGVSAEVGRQTSPFVAWSALTEAGAEFNHKVISVEPAGSDDVYNGTVDDVHNFFVGGWDSQTRSGNRKSLYINNLQCGEIPLPAYGNCCLGHVNLYNMFDPKTGDVDWRKLARTVRVGVRFLDNVLSSNHYPVSECRDVGERSRRIGLGVTGLHYLLLLLGHRYGSEECLEFLERLFGTLRNEAYKASIDLAKEKGAFPAFDAEKFKKEEFFKTLPKRLQTGILEHGIRNAVMLTIAPCGTNSMVLGVSSGIEPIFAPVYRRRFRDGNIWREEIVADSLFAEHYAAGHDLSHFVGAYDISVEDHIRVQATIQQFIDSSISKTTNLPNNYDASDLGDVILKYADSVKGFTIYRQGSKGEEPLTPIDISDTDKLRQAMMDAGVTVHSIETCRGGVCEV